MTDAIALYEHDRMISQLYSLTGPQENLPSILMSLLQNDQKTISKKIEGSTRFSREDLIKIQNRFHNAVLQLSLSA